ncbi:hypothetical protein KAV46_05175 [Candidatus Bathyarchaeota archaeon]|jgi:hypothetical protein|nr:hypothetical protein [Candidatus Bathyarchaeota archaeon]MCK4400357.1 hypothetical protein [Candidatus Bathyarchaeota archaeon]
MTSQTEVKTYIKELTGKSLYTLDQNRRFTVDGVEGKLIFITTSTGNPRNVPLQGTINAYNHIMKHGKITRTEIEEQEYTIRNTVYMAAILSSFPEIEHTTRPITLYKKPIV